MNPKRGSIGLRCRWGAFLLPFRALFILFLAFVLFGGASPARGNHFIPALANAVVAGDPDDPGGGCPGLTGGTGADDSTAPTGIPAMEPTGSVAPLAACDSPAAAIDRKGTHATTIRIAYWLIRLGSLVAYR